MLSRRRLLQTLFGGAVTASLPLGSLKFTPAAVATFNDSFIPELWAKESLAILDECMVASTLVHRDFEFDKRVSQRPASEFPMLNRFLPDYRIGLASSQTRARSPYVEALVNIFFAALAVFMFVGSAVCAFRIAN